jgi:hypothetical protein
LAPGCERFEISASKAKEEEEEEEEEEEGPTLH